MVFNLTIILALHFYHKHILFVHIDATLYQFHVPRNTHNFILTSALDKLLLAGLFILSKVIREKSMIVNTVCCWRSE